MYQIGEGEIEVTFDDLQYQVVDSVDYSTYFEYRGFDADAVFTTQKIRTKRWNKNKRKALT